MKRAIKAIDIYQQRTGRLPASIDEVGRLKEPNDPTRSLDIVDSWNRPFIYRTRAGHAALISFGADGKPGGSWVDQDIDSDHPGAEVKLPYRDFVRLPTFPEILFWASVPAAIGFVLVFFGTKDDQRPSIATVIAIIFVGFTAVLLSGVMTLLDFYPDH